MYGGRAGPADRGHGTRGSAGQKLRWVNHVVYCTVCLWELSIGTLCWNYLLEFAVGTLDGNCAVIRAMTVGILCTMTVGDLSERGSTLVLGAIPCATKWVFHLSVAPHCAL